MIDDPELKGNYAAGLIRVLIVEDHDDYREFVSSLVQSRSEFEVISEVADGAEAVRTAAKLRPDLILMDIGLPKLNGLEAARRILQSYSGSKIVFVSQEASPDIVVEAFRIGAAGYVAKIDAAFDLMSAANCVLRGQKFMSRSIANLECNQSVLACTADTSPRSANSTRS